jgi:hypothetical protein
MHAVLITFESAAEMDDLKGPFTDYANALHGIGGLVCKTWIRDESTLGGFHIFTSREAADAYLGGDLAAGLIANEAFSEFQIRHFDVLDEFSAITGSPEKTLV